MEKLKKFNLQLILIGIIIVIAVLYAIFIKPYYYNFNGGEIFFEPTYVESFSDNTTYDIHAYGENIYISSVNGFKKVARDGEHLWDQSFYAKNASLLSAGKYMCVVDINGTDAYLFNEDGLIVEINTDYPILMADLNSIGAMTFLMETGSTYLVDIYNRLGNKAASREIVMEEDGYPISMDVSEDGSVLAISHIKIDEVGHHTNLTFFSFNDATKKDPNHIIGAQLLDGVWMAEVAFYDPTHLIGISQDMLYFYDCGESITLMSTYALQGKLTDYEMTGDAIILVMYDQLAMTYGIEVLDFEGESIGTHEIEGQYSGISADEDHYFIIESYGIEKYKKNDLVWFTESSRKVSNIISLGNEYYLVEYGSSFEIIKMKEM